MQFNAIKMQKFNLSNCLQWNKYIFQIPEISLKCWSLSQSSRLNNNPRVKVSLPQLPRIPRLHKQATWYGCPSLRTVMRIRPELMYTIRSHMGMKTTKYIAITGTNLCNHTIGHNKTGISISTGQEQNHNIEDDIVYFLGFILNFSSQDDYILQRKILKQLQFHTEIYNYLYQANTNSSYFIRSLYINICSASVKSFHDSFNLINSLEIFNQLTSPIDNHFSSIL